MKKRLLRKRVVSLLMAMILTGSLSVTGVLNHDTGADVAQAADTATDTTATSHVEHLIYVDDNTVPVCNETEYEDYIFAGWYSTELCTDDQILTSSQLEADKPYYAKFIPADVLSVKCQIPYNFKPSDTSTNLRVMTTLDSVMYSDVGFDFYKYDAATESYVKLDTYKYSDDEENNKLYRKITATQNGEAYNYSANMFDISSVAYFTGTVTGIRQGLFDTPILIKPFLMTKNGTQVYGISRCIRITDSYNNYVTVPVYMNSDRDLGSGTVTVTPRPFGDATATTADIAYLDYVPGDSAVLDSVTSNGNVVTLNIKNEAVSEANGLLATLRYKCADNTTWEENDPRYTFDIKSESTEAADLSNLVYFTGGDGNSCEHVGANIEIVDSESSYSQEIRATYSGYGNHFQIPFRSSEGATGFSVRLKGTGNFTQVNYYIRGSADEKMGDGTATTNSNSDWTTLSVSNENIDWSKVSYIKFMFILPSDYKANNDENDARVYLDNFQVIGDTTENDFEVVDIFHRNTQASGTEAYTNWYTDTTKEGRSNTYVIATLPELYGFQHLSYGSSTNTAPQIFTGKTIMLACDMVLNTNHTNYQNWVSSAPTNKWLGIGCFYNSTQYAFDGTFDGQGHNIYGVYMDGAQDTQGTKNGRGFFNRAAGTIKNFRLRNSCIIGQQSMVGSIVGVAWRGAGAVSTSLNLDGVYSNAYVKSSGANHVVGGLVGTRNIPVSFNNCQFAGINNGSFNTNYRSDGGLLGTVDSKVAKVTVTNCAVTGVIKRDGNITAAATITGGTGGIVGKVTIGGSLSIEGCYINFATDDNSTLAGAIVQRTKTDYSLTVKNVLNDTNLKAAASTDLTSAEKEGLLTGSAATSETWKAEGFFDATYWDVTGDVPVLKSFMDIQ